MDFDKKFDLRKLDIDLNPKDIESFLNRLGFKPNGSAERMFGGFSSLNYRFKNGNEDLVLRVSSKSSLEFQGELSVMRRVKKSVPVPDVLAFEINAPELNKNVAVVSFMEGTLLSQVEDDMSQTEIEDVAYSVGENLANIHAIQFPEAGFFGEGCKIIEKFSPFKSSVIEYMQNQLDQPLLKERLGKTVFDRLNSYIRDNTSIFDTLPNSSNLTHSDFNQKNILVNQVNGRWQVSAILDWEFSFSGSSMIDFGNFFRYKGEMSPLYEEPLLAGYKSNGGLLSDTWREQAKFLDLISMMQFLIRKDEFPKTFKTATSVILNTL